MGFCHAEAVQAPVQALGPHVAALGMRFWQGMASLRNRAIIFSSLQQMLCKTRAPQCHGSYVSGADRSEQCFCLSLSWNALCSMHNQSPLVKSKADWFHYACIPEGTLPLVPPSMAQ